MEIFQQTSLKIRNPQNTVKKNCLHICELFSYQTEKCTMTATKTADGLNENVTL